jgi:hypothetical protein
MILASHGKPNMGVPLPYIEMLPNKDNVFVHRDLQLSIGVSAHPSMLPLQANIPTVLHLPSSISWNAKTWASGGGTYMTTADFAIILLENVI